MVTNRGSTGGRKSKPALPAKPQTTLIIDNGAYTLKAGRVSGSTVDVDAPLVVPNCIARNRLKKTYVAAELEQCRDFSEIQFRRPVERGFVVNWEAQKEIWDRQFFDDKAPLRCDPAETRLILAEPPNSLPVLQSNCDQIVFEEYGFTSYYRGIGALQSSLFRFFVSLTMLLLQGRPSMPTTTSRASSTHRKKTRPPRTLPPRSSLWSTRATPTQPSHPSSTDGHSNPPSEGSTSAASSSPTTWPVSSPSATLTCATRHILSTR